MLRDHHTKLGLASREIN